MELALLTGKGTLASDHREQQHGLEADGRRLISKPELIDVQLAANRT